MDMQCSVDIENGYAASAGSIDMQRVDKKHGHAALGPGHAACMYVSNVMVAMVSSVQFSSCLCCVSMLH
jgi:hypothetical protein